MLSGQYDFLVNNMWITEILAVIMLILPFFLLFIESKWIFFYYTVSIVANLPLIFNMSFNFSYEAILGLVVIVNIFKDIIKEKRIRYQTTKENLVLMLMIIIVLFVNLITSVFYFNPGAFLLRLFIYIVNMFILAVYTYYFKDSKSIRFIKNGFVLGAVILVISMIVELVYGYYYKGIRNLRPAGLLLDPNVCAFALNLAFILSFMDRKRGIFINDILMVSARVLILFGVFLTVSRSAYIGTIFVLIALTIYYSKGKRKWVVPSVVVVFIVLYLVFNNIIIGFIKNIYNIIDLDRIFPSNNYVEVPPGSSAGGGDVVDGGDYSNSRLALISAAFNIFANNFITGVGIGNVTKEISLLTDMEMNAHNLYLQVLAESGIIMLFVLLIFLYYLFVFINKVTKKYKFIILMLFGIIFIESMFNHNLLNINIIYLVLAIVFGLTMLSAKDRRVYVIGRENLKIRKKVFK